VLSRLLPRELVRQPLNAGFLTGSKQAAAKLSRGLLRSC